MLRNTNFSTIFKNSKPVQTDINAFRSKGEHNESLTCSFPTHHVQTHLGTELQRPHGPSQELVQKQSLQSEEQKNIPLHTPKTQDMAMHPLRFSQSEKLISFVFAIAQRHKGPFFQ